MGTLKKPFTPALQFEPDSQIFGRLEVLDSHCYIGNPKRRKRLTFNYQIGLVSCLFGRCGLCCPRGIAIF
jgi:hypothetical protein